MVSHTLLVSSTSFSTYNEYVKIKNTGLKRKDKGTVIILNQQTEAPLLSHSHTHTTNANEHDYKTHSLRKRHCSW